MSAQPTPGSHVVAAVCSWAFLNVCSRLVLASRGFDRWVVGPYSYSLSSDPAGIDVAIASVAVGFGGTYMFWCVSAECLVRYVCARGGCMSGGLLK